MPIIMNNQARQISIPAAKGSEMLHINPTGSVSISADHLKDLKKHAVVKHYLEGGILEVKASPPSAKKEPIGDK
jgi:hypothetical protein